MELLNDEEIHTSEKANNANVTSELSQRQQAVFDKEEKELSSILNASSVQYSDDVTIKSLASNPELLTRSANNKSNDVRLIDLATNDYSGYESSASDAKFIHAQKR